MVEWKKLKNIVHFAFNPEPKRKRKAEEEKQKRIDEDKKRQEQLALVKAASVPKIEIIREYEQPSGPTEEEILAELRAKLPVAMTAPSEEKSSDQDADHKSDEHLTAEQKEAMRKRIEERHRQRELDEAAAKKVKALEDRIKAEIHSNGGGGSTDKSPQHRPSSGSKLAPPKEPDEEESDGKGGKKKKDITKRRTGERILLNKAMDHFGGGIMARTGPYRLSILFSDVPLL